MLSYQLQLLSVNDVDVTLLCVSKRRAAALCATKLKFNNFQFAVLKEKIKTTTEMFVLAEKILKILLAFLVGFQVKIVINR